MTTRRHEPIWRRPLWKTVRREGRSEERGRFEGKALFEGKETLCSKGSQNEQRSAVLPDRKTLCLTKRSVCVLYLASRQKVYDAKHVDPTRTHTLSHTAPSFVLLCNDNLLNLVLYTVLVNDARLLDVSLTVM